MMKTLRDWMLPFVATFFGVFLAAGQSHQSSVNRQQEQFDQLLRVLHDDTRAAWQQSEAALLAISKPANASVLPDNMTYQKIRLPSLLLSSLRANPSVLAQFHPHTFAQLIVLLPDIEGGIASYSSLLQAIEAVTMAENLSERDRQSISSVRRYLSTEPYAALVKSEHAMKRAVFLLQVEQSYRAGNIDESKLQALITAAEFSL
jgi:hypothetical protein